MTPDLRGARDAIAEALEYLTGREALHRETLPDGETGVDVGATCGGARARLEALYRALPDDGPTAAEDDMAFLARLDGMRAAAGCECDADPFETHDPECPRATAEAGDPEMAGRMVFCECDWRGEDNPVMHRPHCPVRTVAEAQSERLAERLAPSEPIVHPHAPGWPMASAVAPEPAAPAASAARPHCSCTFGQYLRDPGHQPGCPMGAAEPAGPTDIGNNLAVEHSDLLPSRPGFWLKGTQPGNRSELHLFAENIAKLARFAGFHVLDRTAGAYGVLVAQASKDAQRADAAEARAAQAERERDAARMGSAHSVRRVARLRAILHRIRTTQTEDRHWASRQAAGGLIDDEQAERGLAAAEALAIKAAQPEAPAPARALDERAEAKP